MRSPMTVPVDALLHLQIQALGEPGAQEAPSGMDILAFHAQVCTRDLSQTKSDGDFSGGSSPRTCSPFSLDDSLHILGCSEESPPPDEEPDSLALGRESGHGGEDD